MSKIIYRINSQTTVVQASAVKSTEDLAYAMGFLANHRLYKMSKGPGGVTVDVAVDVAQAFHMAAERFEIEVLSPLTNEGVPGAISRLGQGEVTNPWEFVS